MVNMLKIAAFMPTRPKTEPIIIKLVSFNLESIFYIAAYKFKLNTINKITIVNILRQFL